MARVSKSDAAKLIGVTRQSLYRYLAQGRISAHPDGTIDTAELLRAGFELQNVTVAGDVTGKRHMRHDVTSSVTASVTPVTPPGETALLHQMIALLQRELEESRERERAAREREALVLRMLEQAQQQSQRLLEMPRQRQPAPVSSPRSSVLPESWQRIIDFMRRQDRPVRPTEVQEALGLTSTPRYTMNRMVLAGLLRRVETGVYEVV